MKRYRITPGSKVDLDRFDPDDTALWPGGKQAAAEESDAMEKKLRDLQELLFAEHKRRVLIVLQGMDTSGKDGTVRHVMSGFNPAGVHVYSFKKPTEEELAHDYLRCSGSSDPSGRTITAFSPSIFRSAPLL